MRARRLVSGMLYATPIMCQNQKAEKLKYTEIASLPGGQPEGDGDEGWLSMAGRLAFKYSACSPSANIYSRKIMDIPKTSLIFSEPK
jgi:hypothetical protein